MDKGSKIFIVGHDDFVEGSLWKYFTDSGYLNVFSSSRMGMDPTIQATVFDFFQTYRPEYVFLFPTQSGGIGINQQRPADFIYHNLSSQDNILYASWKFGVKKLLFYAPACVYPKECVQPIKEEYLLTGRLEESSEPYAVAKIAGIKLCQAYRRQYGLNTIVVVPAALYGPGCDMNEQTGHVMGALIGKFKEAVVNHKSEVMVWGTGAPKREFLYIDDFIGACFFLMEQYDDEGIINAGSGQEVSIKELAQTVAGVCGFKGKILFDETKPNGVPRKLLDSARLKALGWKPRMSLKEGLMKACV